MQDTVEQRLVQLETRLATLTTQVLQLTPRPKDWQSVAGTWTDDELSRQIDRNGAEWRAQSPDS